MRIKKVDFKRLYVKIHGLISKSWLFLGIGLLLFNSLFNYFWEDKVNPRDRERIEHSIALIQDTYAQVADMWLDTVSVIGKQDIWAKEYLFEPVKQYNSAIFLFENNRMVFWSRAPQETDSVLCQVNAEPRFSRFGDKISIPFMKQAGTRKAVLIIGLSRYYPDKYVPSDIGEEKQLVDISKYEILPYSIEGVNIHDTHGDFLFSLIPRHEIHNLRIPDYLGWLGFFLLCYGLTVYAVRNSTEKNVWSFSLSVFFTVILLRVISVCLNLPVTGGYLFDDYYPLNKVILSRGAEYLSVGNILVDAILTLMMMLMLFRLRNKIRLRLKHRGKLYKQGYLVFCSLVYVCFVIWQYCVFLLLIVSGYSEDTTYEIFTFGLDTLVIYVIVIVLITAYITFRTFLFSILKKQELVIVEIGSLLAISTVIFIFYEPLGSLAYILWGFSCIIMVLNINGFIFKKLGDYRLYIGIVSILLTVLVFYSNISNQNRKQKDIALHILENEQYTNNSLYAYLLMDEKLQEAVLRYSYIKVRDGKVVEYNGDYVYEHWLQVRPEFSDGFYYGKQYKHFICTSADGREVVVVSRPIFKMVDFCSMLFYIFILLSIGEFILFGGWIYISDIQHARISLYSRVRIALIGVVSFAVIIIMWAVMHFFIEERHSRERNILFNKSYAINTGYEQRLCVQPVNSSLIRAWAEENEIKYQVNINIYDSEGKLICSSSQKAIINKIVPLRINPTALKVFREGQVAFFHEEYVGAKKCNSYYAKLIHKGGEIVYLNIFSRNISERAENNSLIVNILNIFLFILFVSVMISMILYKQIMKSLNLIKESMRDIRYRRKIDNSKYKGGTEVDELITQYNNTIAELEATYKELAKTEREAAWKTMARQIAHEIKNPLTPIKLKVQMIQRRKRKGDPNWANNIDDALALILEQIDILSNIVSEFSSFAKMNENVPKRTDMDQMMKDIAAFYSDYSNIEVRYVKEVEGAVYANIDYENFWRVLTNLFVNAIYAIGDRPDGLIELTLNAGEKEIEIAVKDNGCGISDKDKDKIFTLNFTTKKSGSGIGLAISMQIVKSMKGKIYFESTEGVGTVFYIILNRSN
ncbi:MAG TPA: HAMP domain-containing histidine kinase [Candidatus Avirikenella pullistercoris]|nr:HAMP domain-containing histidine kinase [Candidatus Avirikenella pullistercoris]